jgi:hypothetical protein
MLACVPSGEDTFSGSVISHVSEHLWPFDRGRCVISASSILCDRHCAAYGRSRADAPVPVTRYRLFPFIVRTVVWFDIPERRGFSPWTGRPLVASLERHGWPMAIRTVSWMSWFRSHWRR